MFECFERAKDICIYFEFIWPYLNIEYENYIEKICKRFCEEYKNNVQNELPDEIKLINKDHYTNIRQEVLKPLKLFKKNYNLSNLNYFSKSMHCCSNILYNSNISS